MAKNTTKLMKISPCPENNSLEKQKVLEVHPKTLKKILQFASAYRSPEIAKELQIDLFLN